MTAIRAAVSNTIFFKNSQGVTVRGLLLKLSRNAIVLELYNPYSIVQMSEVLNDLKVMRGENVIYSGRAVVNNLLNTGLMLIASATLVDPWKDLSELDDPDRIATEIRYFIEDWEKNNKLRAGYQLVVGEIRAFLSDFYRWLEQFDVGGGNTRMLNLLFEALSPQLASKLTALFTRFEEEIRLIPEDAVTAHKAYAQNNIHPLILRSPFIHRTFYKPLGYAGDYEMVNMMMRDPREGENLYTQLINSFYLQLSATTAHRNRITLLHRMLAEKARLAASENRVLRVFNIACGPAIELQRFVSEECPAECRFDLLDFSEETLAHAREKIQQANVNSPDRLQFNFIFKSVHTLLKEASSDNNTEAWNSYDVVYCAGLFDYLSDKVCARLLRLFYNWIKPGGVVLATNVHADSDCRGTMEHIAEWYLIYRNEQQFLELAANLGDTRVFAEETGVNIFLEIKKPEAPAS